MDNQILLETKFNKPLLSNGLFIYRDKTLTSKVLFVYDNFYDSPTNILHILKKSINLINSSIHQLLNNWT